MQFPSLAEYLYSSSSMEEVWEKYILGLRQSDSLYLKSYANKLEEFQAMKEESKLIELEQEFCWLKQHLRLLQKDLGVHLLLTRRQKDFLGLNEKIRLFMKKEEPLEKVRDFLGFRIVLCSEEKDSMQTIEATYKVLNRIIKFFVGERNFLMAEAEPLVDLGFDINEHPDIIIPEESLILPGCENNVKDYIKNPKGNGYQGLHLIFVKQKDGIVFEIQIRTMAMHVRAEEGSAKHEMHKDTRYEGENIEVDFSKVKISGFVATNDKVICDTIGLSKSIDPFNVL